MSRGVFRGKSPGKGCLGSSCSEAHPQDGWALSSSEVLPGPDMEVEKKKWGLGSRSQALEEL